MSGTQFATIYTFTEIITQKLTLDKINSDKIFEVQNFKYWITFIAICLYNSRLNHYDVKI
jgi:hypothetical protein